MRKTTRIILAGIALLGQSQFAYSSSVALIEQSVSAMGNAYSAGATFSEDASTIFFNPAGMSRLCRKEFLAGFHVLMPGNHYNDEGSVLYDGTTPLTGDNGKQFGETAVVSHAYYVQPINKCWTFGVGVFSPYGLITDYGGSWTGRYHAIRSALMTVNINPSISYQVSDSISVGFGISAMYCHTKISNAVDYGSIAWIAAGGNGAAETGLTNLGFLPQTQDGHAYIKGNSWGFGLNTGVLWQPCCGTLVGLHFRSGVKQDIDAKERFTHVPTLVADPSQAGGLEGLFTTVQAIAATDAKAKAGVTLPGTISASAYHELNSCWAIMGDLTWTNWKKIDEVRFRFNTDQPDQVITTKWKNTIRASVGATYRPNCTWVFRTGFAYDETPIKNAKLRSARIPDSDRYWLAIGTGYRYSNCLRFDIGYSHLFSPSVKIDKSGFEHSEDLTRGGLKGKYRARADILSAQFDYRF